MKSPIYREDVDKCLLRISDTVKDEFVLTDREDDDLYKILDDVLDRFFHYPDYRSYL